MSTIPNWNSNLVANRLNKSYVKDFIDISGNLVVRENADLYVTGNITTQGNILVANSTFNTDVSLNYRVFVGSDASINGNITINGDASLNGTISACHFATNSISLFAFDGAISSPTPDYTQPTIIYEKNFQANADVSMNGSTIRATNIKMDGNIQFSDGTILDSYDSNLDTITSIDISYNSYNNPALYNTTDIGLNYTKANNQAATRVSANGKYILVTKGIEDTPSVSNQGPTRSGIFRSADYGKSYQFVVLPPTPFNNLSLVIYMAASMSLTGKYMMVVTSGSSGSSGSWTDMVLGWSMDYGNTWSSYDLASLIGVQYGSNITAAVRGIDINADGSRAIMSIHTNDGAGLQPLINGYWISYNWSSNPLTWSRQLNTTASTIPFRCNIVKNRLVISSQTQNSAAIYDISNNISFLKNATSTTSSNQFRFSTSVVGNTVFTSSTADNRLKKLTNLHSDLSANIIESDIVLPGTPSASYRYSVVVSPSGRYVMVGHNSLTAYQPCIDLFNATFPIYFSNDYGETFNGPIKLTSTNPMSTINTVAMSDTGRVFITSSSNNYVLGLNFAKFKASTFTNLGVINTLKVGSNQYTSDYRIKTDVVPLDATITIDRLRPVKYLQTRINKPQYGLIAHELQEHFPHLVKGEKDGEELQSVNYTGLIAILVNEMKRLKRELGELENLVR
jgi:hypothetical protein